MKYSAEQLILASHVRTLAADLWRHARNDAKEQWDAKNPEIDRSMGEFGTEFGKANPLKGFVKTALQELEATMDIMIALPPSD